MFWSSLEKPTIHVITAITHENDVPFLNLVVVKWNRNTVLDRILWTIRSVLSKTTQITGDVGEAEAVPPTCKVGTFFLMSLTLTESIFNNFYLIKWNFSTIILFSKFENLSRSSILLEIVENLLSLCTGYRKNVPTLQVGGSAPALLTPPVIITLLLPPNKI